MNILYLIIIFIVGILIFNLYYKSVKVKFFNKEELSKILKNNKYLNRLKKIDLRVRKVRSIEEYINNINHSVSEFCLFDKLRLMVLSFYINLKISCKKNHSYLNYRKLNKIPWKFGLIKGNKYEEGLSHTRGDTIILSEETLKTNSNYDLCRTLLHEKIHLYQKKYKEDISKFIELNKFKKVDKDFIEYKNIRANPDTDSFIYKNRSGKLYTAKYKKNAKSILDVNFSLGNNQKYEHPYELMSIRVSNYIFP